jgi:hypothetical protein
MYFRRFFHAVVVNYMAIHLKQIFVVALYRKTSTNMYRLTAFLFFMMLAAGAFAQSAVDTGGVTVQEDPRVMLLMGKWKEVKERTDGKMDGWRVKIHFGTDRDKAKNVKASFMGKHPGVSAYEDYVQPLFVILAGDFRTRMEAYKFYLEIKSEYPAAFIVQSEIELPKIELSKPEQPNGNGTGSGR